MPIAPSAIAYHAATGEARFHATNLAISDYGNFSNAIAKKPHRTPSHVSFDVHWQGGLDAQQLRDPRFGFAGTFVSGTATISFTARNDDAAVVYRSAPDGQHVLYAGAGTERNGVFFV